MKKASKTNVEQVKKQNAAAEGKQGQYGTEFASDTNVEQVKEQNATAEKNKSKNS